ncbi:hypothetical protein Pelo_4096 [Pelomyxa schiedti]|nr:hypothetical protein Pelo_4096 [Pelomyxa schiedti]
MAPPWVVRLSSTIPWKYFCHSLPVMTAVRNLLPTHMASVSEPPPLSSATQLLSGTPPTNTTATVTDSDVKVYSSNSSCNESSDQDTHTTTPSPVVPQGNCPHKVTALQTATNKRI